MTDTIGQKIVKRLGAFVESLEKGGHANQTEEAVPRAGLPKPGDQRPMCFSYDSATETTRCKEGFRCTARVRETVAEGEQDVQARQPALRGVPGSGKDDVVEGDGSRHPTPG